MSTATIAQSDQLNNHELKKLAEKTAGLLKLSIVQGLNGTMSPQAYRFRPKELRVGGRAAMNYPSAALVVANRVRQLDPQRVHGVRLALGRDLSLTSTIRSQGVDMRSEKPVAEQVNLKEVYSFINDATFNQPAMERMVSDLAVRADLNGPPARDAALAELRSVGLRFGSLLPAGWLDDLTGRLGSGGGQVVLNKSVKFRIHEVKCIDETNPE